MELSSTQLWQAVLNALDPDNGRLVYTFDDICYEIQKIYGVDMSEEQLTAIADKVSDMIDFTDQYRDKESTIVQGWPISFRGVSTTERIAERCSTSAAAILQDNLHDLCYFDGYSEDAPLIEEFMTIRLQEYIRVVPERSTTSVQQLRSFLFHQWQRTQPPKALSAEELEEQSRDRRRARREFERRVNWSLKICDSGDVNLPSNVPTPVHCKTVTPENILRNKRNKQAPKNSIHNYEIVVSDLGTVSGF